MDNYDEDVLLHLRKREVQLQINPNYMLLQSDITWYMRKVLLNWLIEVHCYFGLYNDTLFLAISILDRFLDSFGKRKKNLIRNRLQLVGSAALWVASKIEEYYRLNCRDLVSISNEAFTYDDLIEMESKILTTLEFDLTAPTSLHFLRYWGHLVGYDAQTHTTARYFAELMLIDHKFLKYPCSVCAAVAVCRALDCTSLPALDMFTESELRPCMEEFIDLLQKRNTCAWLEAVNNKYSHSAYYGVAKQDF